MSDGTYKKERRKLQTAPEIPPLSPAPPLTDRERERIMEMLPVAKEHFPEVVPMVKDLVDAGLIHGWRNVRVKVEKNGTD